MSFSIDDVRDTFTADMNTFLSNIEAAARRASSSAATGTELPSSFDIIGDNTHSIGGTSKLVNARSLASSSGLLEEIARHGGEALHASNVLAQRAQRCAELLLEGVVAMRSMLKLELEGQSADAGWLATDWEQRVSDLRGGLTGPVAAKPPDHPRAEEPIEPASEPDEAVGAFAFEDDDDVGHPLDAAPPGGGSMSEAISDELREIFEQEAREAALALKGHLQNLAADHNSRAASTHLERLYHTLKGAAATVGLPEVSDAAKELQLRMERVVDDGEKVTAEFVQRLVVDTDTMFGIAGLAPLSLGAPAAESHGASDAAGAHGSFVDEARVICNDAIEAIRGLDRGASDQSRAVRKDLGRLFHRLKGSALVVSENVLAEDAAHLQALCEKPSTSPEYLAAEVTKIARQLGLSLVSERGPRAGHEGDARPSVTAVKLPDAPGLWEAFTQECTELLDSVERSALSLETSHQPKQVLDGLLRTVHTLKGALNTVGLTPTANEIHLIEDFLTALQERPILPSARSVATLLLEVHRRVRTSLVTAERGFVETNPRLEAKIGAVLSGGRSSEPPSTGATSARSVSRDVGTGASAGPGSTRAPASSRGPSTGTSDAVAPELERRYIRVPTERLDALMNLVGELVVSRSRMVSRVDSLRAKQIELGRSRSRLVDTVTRFVARYEFADLDGKRKRIHPGNGNGHERPGEVVFDAERAAAMRGKIGEEGFGELELDRYEDVHILSRSLSEIQDDVHEVDVELVRDLAEFAADAETFGGIVSNIQGEVTRARMVPLESLFSRLRLPVRDACERSGKDVRVITVGEEVTIDKTIADALFAPMLHLVRNAVGHGVERSALRVATGKPSVGVITLSARHESGQIVVEVSDDGGGLDLAALHARGVALGVLAAGTPIDDPAVKELVFASGLSTEESAGAVSGRGVGCDVVRRSIERMNGDVAVSTKAGVGTTFVLTLPVTLAITRAILVRHNGNSFAFPMYFTDRILAAEEQVIVESAGMRRLSIDDNLIPLRRMEEFFDQPIDAERRGPVVVLRLGDQSVAVEVDAVIGQAEIVVKHLGNILDGHPLFAGMTIRGTGELALIVDVPGLLEAIGAGAAARVRPDRVAAVANPRAMAAATAESAPVLNRRVQVLFVDDSLSVRKVAERVLSSLNVDVTLAMDGIDALTKLRGAHFDIVFTDLEMPRMHGYDLIREVRYIPTYSDLPIVVVSSRSGQKHKDKARTLGATAYITKPFTPEMLQSVIDRCVKSVAPSEPQPPATRPAERGRAEDRPR